MCVCVGECVCVCVFEDADLVVDADVAVLGEVIDLFVFEDLADDSVDVVLEAVFEAVFEAVC